MTTQPMNTYNEDAARAAGVVVDEPVFANYWGFESTEKFYLPDGKQFIVLSRMNEGAKSKYQNSTRSAITLKRQSGDASIISDVAKERHALIEACAKDWNFFRPDPSNNGGMVPAPFVDRAFGFRQWLLVADPAIIEDLEKKCREVNPWLLNDMTVEAIDEEILSLNERRDELLKRDSGE